jgi:hypothetical protein
MGSRGDVRTIVLAFGLAAALTGCVGSSMTTPTVPPSVTPATVAASSVTPQSSTSPASATTTMPTPTVTKASTIVLSGTGIGPLLFGSPEKDVLTFLKPTLGTPKVQGQVGGCEGAGSGYQSYATFGQLRIRFAAADDSSTSPRTLQSWDITFTGAPKAPLALAKGIPVGKSLAQLKALYPTGSGLEHMGAWAAEGVILVPPTKVGGETLVHAGDLDWCT